MLSSVNVWKPVSINFSRWAASGQISDQSEASIQVMWSLSTNQRPLSQIVTGPEIPGPAAKIMQRGQGEYFAWKKRLFEQKFPLALKILLTSSKFLIELKWHSFFKRFFAQNNIFFWILWQTIHPWKEKKYWRKDLEDLEAFHKYKEAFDHFDWNKTKTIATSVSVMAENIWKLSIVNSKS